MTPLQRALRYVRGEGWTVRPRGGGRFDISDGPAKRQTMSRAELLDFAGIVPEERPLRELRQEAVDATSAQEVEAVENDIIARLGSDADLRAAYEEILS